MADYKLKLDIDAALLEKKIAQALKKSGLTGMSGGSGGGSRSANLERQAEKFNKTSEKLQKEGLTQRQKELHQNRIHLRNMDYQRQMAVKAEAYKNAMVRASGQKTAQSFQQIGQLFGGRMGGAGGAIIGQLASQKGFWKQPKSEEEQNMYLAPGRLGGKTAATEKNKLGKLQKENRIPRAVKIAGVAAGAAGMAGLGKMIIDSSPMMKVMLKLMNLGIMFTLRPIGDMLGMIFRPMMINFVKWSVGWYKMWAEHLPTWQAWGESLAEFMSDPWNGLKDLIISALKTLGKMFNIPVADIQKLVTDINVAWAQISEAVKPFVEAWNNFWENTIPQFIADVFSGKAIRDFQKSFDDAWKGFIGFFEGMWKGISDGFSGVWDMLKGLPIIGGLFGGSVIPEAVAETDPEFIGPTQPDVGSDILGDTMEKVNEAAEVANDWWVQISEGAAGAATNAWNSFMNIGKIDKAFGQSENTLSSTPIYAKNAESHIHDISKTFEGASSWIRSNLRTISRYRKADGSRTRSAKIASQAMSRFGGGLVTGGGASASSRYRITFGDGTSVTQGLDPRSYSHLNMMRAKGEQYRGKSILSIMKMAKGGIINEPIFGVGQNSGRGYLMGEKGPETVTPGVGTSPGGGNTFNITINASNVGDIERQLKPAILKMLKESTSRAGIV